MNLEHLEMFLTIARFGSINKAADALFLAQSTLTHRLKQLEKQVSAPLFVRTAGGVSLTPEGRRFVPIATSIVEQMRSFTEEAGQSRPLSITGGKAFIAYELPRLIGGYRRLIPNFTCYVRSTLYEESITALLTGTADLALLGSEVYHPQLQQILLPSDRILLIVSPAHPWAAGFPGWSEWGLQEVIAFGNQTAPFRQRIDRFLAENGVYPNVLMELDSISAVKGMVMQNLGVAMLPERTVREEVAAGRLIAHDIAGGFLTRPTLLAYPKHKEQDHDLQRFVAYIRETF
jgi:LysR family transcriptional regulator, low CO2-responsive transcriptional regulator